MTDMFLDRLGDQLRAAERALIAANAPRRRRVTRKAAVLAFAALAVAVPALAATEPWKPIFGRPALRDVPAGTSESPIPNDEQALLGVLRRPQEPRDHGEAAQDLLRSVGQEFAGVRPDSLRLLTSSTGHSALLVSAEKVGRETENPVCIAVPHGGFCGGAATLRTGLLGTFGANVVGLVPDGAAKVELTFADGQTRSADIRDNFFWIDEAPTTQRTVPGPDGQKTAPMTMTAAFTTTWLDGEGHAVGPPS